MIIHPYFIAAFLALCALALAVLTIGATARYSSIYRDELSAGVMLVAGTGTLCCAFLAGYFVGIA